MKNIKFKNDEIKNEYQTIVSRQRGLSGIMLLLIQDTEEIKITSIIDNIYGKELIIIKNNLEYIIDIDALKGKIYLKTPDKPYSYIYDNYPRKFVSPSGYLYQNNNRTITEKITYKLSNQSREVKHFLMNDDGIDYVISLKTKNNKYDISFFIQELLYAKEKYLTIRDLFLKILKMNNQNLEIKICDTKGSIIIIDDGLVSKYIEYQEKDDEHQKIYLENNKFYIEKKVKEEYQDEITSFVKKIGEINGKEERQN